VSEKICGIDEAGRGALAGPLAVAGVILHKDIKGLDDSKKLSPKKREELFEIIKENSSYKIVFTDNETIDKIGLSEAIKRSIKKIQKVLKADLYIMDGKTSFGLENVKAVVKADSFIKEVSAASILAKVSRDKVMDGLDKEYPFYNFKNHKGYGTQEHIEVIKKYGMSRVHRKSFKIKSLKYPSLPL